MKNRKGFTMVELLATLVILGIVMMIAVPAISKMISSTDEDYYKSLEGTIRSYGQSYFSDRRTLLPKEVGNIKLVPIHTLVQQKYGDSPIDTKGKSCKGNVIVQKKATGSFEYTTCLECPDYKSSTPVCSYDESSNDKIAIQGVENKTIKQGSPFVLPKGKAVINGEKIADVNPSPAEINTDYLTAYDVYYTYKNASKIVKYTVTDQTNPSEVVVSLKLADGSSYQQQWTNQAIYQTLVATDWTRDDLMGSGIRGFQVSYDGQKSWTLLQATDGKVEVTHTDDFDGTVYVKALDHAGNEGKVASYKLRLDKTPPKASITKVQSQDATYNALAVEIEMEATDSASKGLMMCVSSSGYEKDCSYEAFSTSKKLTFGGNLDGSKKMVYVTVKDSAGNKIKLEKEYTLYKECSSTKEQVSDYGACSQSCGGGYQYRTRTYYDKNTNKVCSVDSNYQPRACNTQSCSPVTEITAPAWRNFRLIVPLNDTTAVGLSFGGGTMNTFDSYTEATVIKFENNAVTYGPTQRVLSGANGAGMAATRAIRLDNDRLILVGSSSSNKTHVGYLTTAVLQVNGTSVWPVGVQTVPASNSGDVNGFCCKDAGHCVASTNAACFTCSTYYFRGWSIWLSGNQPSVSEYSSNAEFGYFISSGSGPKIGGEVEGKSGYCSPYDAGTYLQVANGTLVNAFNTARANTNFYARVSEKYDKKSRARIYSVDFYSNPTQNFQDGPLVKQIPFASLPDNSISTVSYRMIPFGNRGVLLTNTKAYLIEANF